MKHSNILKNTILFVLILLLVFPSFGVCNPYQGAIIANGDIIAQDETDSSINLPILEAESAILIEQSSGKILYNKDQHKKLYPASTTKILTALLALEYGNLDDVITVGMEANLIPKDGTIAGLDLGEEIPLEKLIYGIMLPSGNDAAYTTAVYIGQKIKGDASLGINEASQVFYDLMNERAKKAGALNSNFTNPHGYHDSNHYTTAHDLAFITREAMKHEFFRNVVSTVRYQMEDWNSVDKADPTKKEIRYWKNTNKLIDETSEFYYPDATGVKTGYTSNSGQCLVASATRGNLSLIAVVLKSSKEGKWTDSIKLFEYGFENFQLYQGVKKDQRVNRVEVKESEPDDSVPLELIASDSYEELFSKTDISQIQTKIKINEDIKAPIFERQVLGSITYTLRGRVLKKVNLIAVRDVKKKKEFNLIIPVEKGDFSVWHWIIVILLSLFVFQKISRIIARKKQRRYNNWRKL